LTLRVPFLELKKWCQKSLCTMWVWQSVAPWIVVNISSWKDLVVERRVFKFVIWRPQNLWFRYSKKVAYGGIGSGLKFTTIQGLDICEIAWYYIIGLSKSTYMLYKLDSKQCFSFYHMGIKVRINYICQLGKWNPMFNQWLICLQI